MSGLPSYDEWPPAPDDATEWRWIMVLDRAGQRERVRCREVRLWGKEVWFDDATGKVVCCCCWQRVSTEALSRVGQTHADGLYRPIASGTFMPAYEGDDD